MRYSNQWRRQTTTKTTVANLVVAGRRLTTGEHLLQTEIGMHNEGMGAKIIYPWSVVVMVMVTGQSREEKGDRI